MTTCSRTLEPALADLGFTDVPAVRDALLDRPSSMRAATASSSTSAPWSSCGARLADPDLAVVDDEAPVDLPPLRATLAELAERLRAVAEQQAIGAQAARSLSRLSDQLQAHDAVHHDVRARAAHVAELSRCLDGTGGGNVLRMRLTAFVLAARLEEVAAAATERLSAMSDGRFTLVHTDELAKSGARSGLGLQVLDSWTGVARDTSTLSGGETFLASLALALGLADVVQAEAGGTTIETLFVDEGFGTLDEDALEEVMGVLDGLRGGGRTVGWSATSASCAPASRPSWRCAARAPARRSCSTRRPRADLPRQYLLSAATRRAWWSTPSPGRRARGSVASSPSSRC